MLLLLLAACTDPDVDPGPDAYADAVVRFEPGEGAGYGDEDKVLGPPMGAGDSAGSLDVLSLGCGGVIELAFDDGDAYDGEGPDLVVYENAFSDFTEPGIVAASADGIDWTAWPCDLDTLDGCAGVAPVYPDGTGGDAFDLADIGLSEARYVRITDADVSSCVAPTGGFDLDAVEVLP